MLPASKKRCASVAHLRHLGRGDRAVPGLLHGDQQVQHFAGHGLLDPRQLAFGLAFAPRHQQGVGDAQRQRNDAFSAGILAQAGNAEARIAEASRRFDLGTGKADFGEGQFEFRAVLQGQRLRIGDAERLVG
jgi:hypothetical protein